jgi:hypothetical protein
VVQLYAGIMVVSAVGMEPPHDGRSRGAAFQGFARGPIGRNEAMGMASPTSRQGHLSLKSEKVRTPLLMIDYGVTLPSAGSNDVPDFHMACRTTAILRARAVAARLKPSRFHSARPQRRSALCARTRVKSTLAAS